MEFIHQTTPYLTDGVKTALGDYLGSGGWLTEFEKTHEFEAMLGEFTGAPHVTVVTSGTVALYLALLAAGIGPGDKVIVPNFTMIASPNAVVWAGAEPVLADVERDTLCLDLETATLDSSTKALMYVSINGRCGNLDAVVEFCRANGLTLVEDACQSLGSTHEGVALGTIGDLGVFSFTPHKIITTGQGGAIVTKDKKLYSKINKLKDFHRTAPATDEHDGIGFNFKFTDLQAVVGIEQLKEIGFRIDRKRAIYRRYVEALSDVSELAFLPTDLETVTPWFVDVLLPSAEVRRQLMAYLKANGIGSRPFYPPINHQEMYETGCPRGSLPVSEATVDRGLWLPSSIGLDDGSIDRVCRTVRNFFGPGRR